MWKHFYDLIRKENERKLSTAKVDDPLLGPFRKLPGTWKSAGRGWNMIALPFEDGPFKYRMLVNQYDETLQFMLVDKKVPNRGIKRSDPDPATPDPDPDQFLVALDYQQSINQVAVADFPVSRKAEAVGAAIHHEPGLFLNMADERTEGIDIARLATIPHGDAVLAIGRSSEITDPSRLTNFEVPPINGLPVGVPQSLTPIDPASPRYLDPYAKFHFDPFKGNVTAPGFPGFDVANPHELLNLANKGVVIEKITVLDLDTEIESGGINNIPFVTRQANASAMKSMFWIQEIEGGALRLQYAQVIMLDFFIPRRDGLPGRIRWPHVSINTLDKVSDKFPCPEGCEDPNGKID